MQCSSGMKMPPSAMLSLKMYAEPTTTMPGAKRSRRVAGSHGAGRFRNFSPLRILIFYDRNWNELGSKAPQEGRMDLSGDIEAATGIANEFTSGTRSTQTASVSKRMSWAARRTATREEDIAYCLMGIFDVNMPMLYGEGKKAFIRLQEEILRNSDDHTIFAWTDARQTGEHGLLADSPSAFLDSDTFIPFMVDDVAGGFSRPPAVTGRGLNIELGLVYQAPDQDSSEGNARVAMLECGSEHVMAGKGFLGLLLSRTPESKDHFTRVACHKLVAIKNPPLNTESIFVRQRTLHAKRTPRPRHLILPLKPQPSGRFALDTLFLGDNQNPRFGKGQQLALHALGTSTKRFPGADSLEPIVILNGPGLLAAYVILHHPSEMTPCILMLGSNQACELCFDVWVPTPRDDFNADGVKGIAAYAELHSATSEMPLGLRQLFFPHRLGTKITSPPNFDISVDRVQSPSEEERHRAHSQTDHLTYAYRSSAAKSDGPHANTVNHHSRAVQEAVSLRIKWHRKEGPTQKYPAPTTDPKKGRSKIWPFGK